MISWSALWASPAKAPTEYISQFAIIQGNSIQAISSPYLQPTQVLGAIWSDNWDIYWEVWEKYPELFKIIECESGFNQEARGKAGEIGILQFLPKTFSWMSEVSGIKGNIYNAEDQVKLANWAFKNNLGNHWSCFRKINSSF